MMKDRVEETAGVIGALRNTTDSTVINAEVGEIRQALLQMTSKKGWMDLLKGDRVKSRRRVAIACAVNLMQDLSGSTPISYYTTYM
jgi:hypothetical protein